MTVPEHTTLREFQETGSASAIRRRKLRQKDARLRERIDWPIAILLTCLIGLFGALGWYGAEVEDRRGWIDPDPIRPLPDQRILENLRDSSAPFLGAVALDNGNGDWLLARDDGQVTLVDPETLLLKTETLPSGNNGLVSALSVLSAGCGWLDPSRIDGECADPNAAFLVSEGGGVLSRNSARWSVLLSDKPWIGQLGTPVEQDSVRAMASSADGKWVAVLAGEQGLGLFDEEASLWTVPRDQGPLLEAVKAGELQLVPDRSGFWIASRAGLGRVTTSAPESLVWSTDRETAYLDFEIDSAGSALAIVERPCAGGVVAGCLAIMDVRGVNTIADIVGEEEVPAGLSGSNLIHAAMQGRNIVTLGAAGIHAYDTLSRGWITLMVGQPNSYYAVDDGSIWVSRGDVLAKISGGRMVSNENVEGGPYTQISPISDSEVIGLGRDGQLRLLPSGTIILPRDEPPPDGKQFVSGASLGNQVLLAGTRGVLIHDPVKRRFSWSDAQSLRDGAPGLAQPGTRIHTAADRFWSVNRRTGAVNLVEVTGNYPSQTLSTTAAGPIAAPLRSVSEGENALWIVDANGVDIAVTPTAAGPPNLRSEIGTPRIVPGRLTMAAAYTDGLIFGNGVRLESYDQTARAWSQPFAGPPGQSMAEITVGEGLFSVTDRRNVMHLRESGWVPILDGGMPADFGLDNLTDATLSGRTVYLGGNGAVQSYSLGQSGFQSLWKGGSGNVRIVDVVSNRPVWLSGRRLRWGDRVLTDAQVEGAWRVSDGILARISRGGRLPYTMLFPPNLSDPVCTHFGDPAPTGRLIDAVELPDGRILAVTTQGAGLHDKESRRWITVSGLSTNSDTRLHLSGGWLVQTEQRSMRAVPTANLPRLDSCAPPIAQFNWPQSASGRSVVFDEASGQAAILESNGAVTVWSNGQFQTVLGTPNLGPSPGDIREIATAGQAIHAATKDAIWTYATGRRLWEMTPINTAALGAEIEDIYLTNATEGTALVSIWTNDGRSFGGQYRTGLAQLSLTHLLGAQLPVIDTEAGSIQDVSSDGGYWAVSSSAGVEFGRPDAARLSGNLAMPSGEGVSTIPQRFGALTGFLAGNRASPDLLYLLPRGTVPSALSGSLRRASFRYRPNTDRDWAIEDTGRHLFRIDQDGRVLRCSIEAGGSGDDDCETLSSAPTPMGEDEILDAFWDGSDVYLALRSGLYLVTGELRDFQRVVGPTPSAESRYLTHQGQFFILDRVGGALWRIDGENAWLAAPRVEHLTEFRRELVAHDGTTTFGIYADAPAPTVRGAGSQPQSAITFDWINGAASGLDGEGYALSTNGRRTSSQPLPDGTTQILPQVSLELLGETHSGLFWSRMQSGDLRLLKDDLCQPPAPQPDPADEAVESSEGEEGAEPEGGAGSTEAQSETEPGETDPGTAYQPSGTEDDVAQIETTEPETLKEAPPPEPVACWTEPLGDALEASELGELLGSQQQNGALLLVFSRGQLSLDLQSRTVSELATSYPPILGISSRPSNRTRAVGLLGTRQDGTTEFAPSRIDRNGRVVLGGTGQILGRTAGTSSPWPNMDEGWISWDRATQTFILAGVADPISLTPMDAIVDGQLLPAVAGRASLLSGDFRYGWLTPQGSWLYDAPGANPVLAERRATPQPVGLSDGNFLLSDGSAIAASTGQVAQGRGMTTHQFGALSIVEDLVGQTTENRLRRLDGSVVEAFAAVGFAHDQRLGIGWRGSELVLSTPVGVVPALQLDQIDPLPARAADGRIVNVSGTSYYQLGNDWYRRTGPGQWTGATDPLAIRLAIDRPENRWTVTPGGVRIETSDPTQSWQHDRAQGLDFAVDQLASISGDTGRVVVGTRLGTHQVASGSAVATLGASLTALVPSGGFDALTGVSHGSVIFARAGPGEMVWDASTGTWRQPVGSERLWQSRLAVDGSSIRIQVGSQGAAAWRQLRTPAGSSRFARFFWRSGGRMPFDRATSIHAEPSSNSLWVGTSWGLRRFTTAGADTGEIFDLVSRAASSQTEATAVGKVGRPAQSPGQIVATGAGTACVQITGPAVTAACTSPISLNRRHVLSDRLWIWVQEDAGITGQYDFTDGTSRAISDSPLTRWPHDVLLSATGCDGDRLELWSDGQTLRDGSAGRLPLPGGRYDALHCQQDAVPIGNANQLAAGAYATRQSAFQGPLRRSSSLRWQAVADPRQAAELADQSNGTAVFDSARLRIRLTGSGYAYQYRTAADHWIGIPHVDGLPAIDQTLGFAFSGDRGVSRVTPFGSLVHRFSRSGLELNVDRVRLGTSDRHDAFSTCTMDQIELLDGRAHTSETQPGAPLQFRCRDGQVFREVVGATGDIGKFVALEDDPFAERQLIEDPPIWDWRVRHPDPERPREIDIRFRGEEMPLSGGRFAIDRYLSLAAPFRGEVDLVSETGWWRHPEGRMDVAAGERSPWLLDPAAVIRVGTDRDLDGISTQLCLDQTENQVRLDEEGQAQQGSDCAEWRGAGSFWSYRQRYDGEVIAGGVSRNEIRQSRLLQDGRFQDLIAIGSPRPVSIETVTGQSLVAVPTAQGAVLLDRQGRAQDYVVHPGQDGILPAGQGYLAFGAVGIQAVDTQQTDAICPNFGRSVADLGILAVEQQDQETFRLFLQQTEGASRQARLLDCAVDDPVLRALAMDLSMDRRARHVATLQGLEDATNNLRIGATQSAQPGVLVGDGRRRETSIGQINGSDVLTILGKENGRSVLVLTQNEPWLVDTDAAMSLLSQTTMQPLIERTLAIDEPDLVDEIRSSDTDADTTPEAQTDASEFRPFEADDIGTDPPLEEAAEDATVETDVIEASAEPGAPQDDPPTTQPWPAELVPWNTLPRSTTVEIQQALARLGHYQSVIDGIVGPRTRQAVSEYVVSTGGDPRDQLTSQEIDFLIKISDAQ